MRVASKINRIRLEHCKKRRRENDRFSMRRWPVNLLFIDFLATLNYVLSKSETDNCGARRAIHHRPKPTD